MSEDIDAENVRLPQRSNKPLDILRDYLHEQQDVNGAVIGYTVALDAEMTRMLWEGCERAERENERLRKVVDALPKTADGVPITPGMEVVPPCGHESQTAIGVETIRCYGKGCKGEAYYGENDYYEPGEPKSYPLSQCYSSEAAARASLSPGTDRRGT